MIKIGITGQHGFIGGHLSNFVGLLKDFEIVNFHRDFFNDDNRLKSFVSECDVIVHLAALNRHNEANVIYDTNLALVKRLIWALEETNSKPHVLFSSSSQEERENVYGKSKKEGRELLAEWAKSLGGKFTGMVIPNVFGPFGNPYYNSFIATFCHQLINNQKPVIEVDGCIRLIYVGDVVQAIIKEIKSGQGNSNLQVPHTSEYKVSDILNLLISYKEQYADCGIIPNLQDTFQINLFNTFRSYMDIKHHFPVKFVSHSDTRGAFVEVIRLHTGGQVSFSTTVPGITRGNHFHTRKIERFAVIKGKALIQLRRIGTEEVLDYYLSGEEPAYVDMPVWYTHNIKNVGDEDLYTIFWINEFYNEQDPDTYFENVQ